MTKISVISPGRIGANIGTASLTLGTETRTTSAVTSYRYPQAVSGLPRIVGSPFSGDALTVDITGLTGSPTYVWREVGGATLATTAGFTSTMMTDDGKNIEVEVTCDQGVLVSPPWHLYAHGDGDDHAAHMADDTAVVALAPHNKATHIAVASGPWTTTSTWRGGVVPRNGARVLIPQGITVTYNNAEANIRLDWIRIDGTLTTALDRSTKWLVGERVVTRTGSLIEGTRDNRLPVQYTSEVIYSAKNYEDKTVLPNDLDLNGRDARLLGRGTICQGVWKTGGRDRPSWGWAYPIAQGATSMMMQNANHGIEAGDTVRISGTKLNTVNTAVGVPLSYQDEERLVTNVDGPLIYWTTDLTYPHNNQLVGSTRTDVYPVVQTVNAYNITIRSEVTAPVWQRGHNMIMHDYAKPDLVGVNFLDLGRTDKLISSGVLRNADADMETSDLNNNRTTTTLTAQSNLQGKYSVHLHRTAIVDGHIPRVEDCYVDRSPGWGIVYHAGFAYIIVCLFIIIAGIVSEQGNEAGIWTGNSSGGTTANQGNLLESPKVKEFFRGQVGDPFHFGYAFAYRGRIIVAHNNVGFSCSWAHVFFHRNDAAETALVPVLSIQRSEYNLKQITRSRNDFDTLSMPDAPIMNFATNYAIGCGNGFFVTKLGPTHSHDANIRIARFVGHGIYGNGMIAEYVQDYNISWADLISSRSGAGADGNAGIVYGTNAFGMVNRNCRFEGFGAGIYYEFADTLGFHAQHDLDNPRWVDIASDFVNCGAEYVEDKTGTPKAFNLLHVRIDNFGNTEIDLHAPPSFTFDNTNLATWSGTSSFPGAFTSTYDNTLGHKVDQLGSLRRLFPKPTDDWFLAKDGTAIRRYGDRVGWWDHAGTAKTHVPMLITCRANGRPLKFLAMFTSAANPPTGQTIPLPNGSFTYAATPLVQTDKLASVATDGTVVIDMLAGATGAGGAGTYQLDTALVYPHEDQSDYFLPDHGTLSRDGATGLVTYTPDEGFVGTDEWYDPIVSQGRYATVRVRVLVGPGGAVAAPVPTTNFAPETSPGGGSYALSLGARPETGGRFIRLTMYSDDAGANWRRLCNGWIPATHKVTMMSDNVTAVTAGNKTVWLKIITDHDDQEVQSSGSIAVVAA